jgi:hypothetical protein
MRRFYQRGGWRRSLLAHCPKFEPLFGQSTSGQRKKVNEPRLDPIAPGIEKRTFASKRAQPPGQTAQPSPVSSQSSSQSVTRAARPSAGNHLRRNARHGRARHPIYCADYHCSHSIALSGDGWPDELRLSDIERASPRLAATEARTCGPTSTGTGSRSAGWDIAEQANHLPARHASALSVRRRKLKSTRALVLRALASERGLLPSS